MTYHSKASLRARHPIHDMEFANEAARLAGTGYALTPDDEGKIALQTNTNTYWQLVDDSPITWDVMGPANATSLERGLMSAADKLALDSLTAGDTKQPIRNETGGPIAKGVLLYAIGWSDIHDRPLVGIADKDDAAKRPAIGVTLATINNNSNADALKVGTLHDVDTSAWAQSDQLVLGGTGNSTAGEFMRPPPDYAGFTGEIQLVGSVTKSDAVSGHIAVNLGGMEIMTADQFFAAAGTNGTPSTTNKYVTNSDPRNSDARTPTSHAASHISGDAIQSATAAQNGLATSTQITKLDGIEALADVTDEANVTSALNGATPGAITVAAGDKVLVQDVSDSDNLKTVTAQSIADLGGGGGGYSEWWGAGNLSSVSSTTGLFYKTPYSGQNGAAGQSAQAIDSPFDVYNNGQIDPFLVPVDGSLDEIIIHFSASATGTGTVGTPTVRIEFFKITADGTSRTSLGTRDITISATGVGVNNNLGSNSPQEVHLNMTDVTVAQGELVGWRFVNTAGDANRINAIKNLKTSVLFVAD